MKPSHTLGPLTALLALTLQQPAVAEQHIQEVLMHTEDAIQAAGDSRSIGVHVSEALDGMEEAKEANARRADVLEYLERSEDELESAVTNAGRFNTDRAWQDAVDAKRYLEAADRAAGGQPPR